MIQPPPLGQRLHHWRIANNWTPAQLALELGLSIGFVDHIESGFFLPSSDICERIERLMSPPLTAEEQQMVERVVNAVRAGYVVSLIRPVKVDEGQIILTFGDKE